MELYTCRNAFTEQKASMQIADLTKINKHITYFLFNVKKNISFLNATCSLQDQKPDQNKTTFIQKTF